MHPCRFVEPNVFLLAGIRGGTQEGLIAALESFERVDLPWLERLDVTSAERLTVRDVNDDLARELQL